MKELNEQFHEKISSLENQNKKIKQKFKEFVDFFFHVMKTEIRSSQD